jgi:hypothetical protein
MLMYTYGVTGEEETITFGQIHAKGSGRESSEQFSVFAWKTRTGSKIRAALGVEFVSTHSALQRHGKRKSAQGFGRSSVEFAWTVILFFYCFVKVESR